VRIFTLCFLLREEEVLLARKRRGNGAGLLKGYGGKVHTGEIFVDAAIRKLREESSLQVARRDCEQRALITTHALGISLRFVVFTSRIWSGTPQDSAEMYGARWFPFKKLPFKEMWEGDKLWLPRMLAGEKFEADVYLDKGNKLKWKRDYRPDPSATELA